jgi:16S rRNA U516 pseudouridylate synthase RsuA-like enzyme
MAFGDLALPDDLAPGDYRQLNSAEIANLKQAVGLK